MQKILLFGILIPAILVGYSMVCYSGTASGNEYAVLLDEQKNSVTTGMIPVNNSVKAKYWKAFSQKNGAWSLMIDRATGTPRCAFGEPVKIAGFSHITGDNVEEASRQFLRENQELFGIDINNIRMIRKDLVNGKWYVSFRQYYKGLEVLLSRIELRIVETGKVMAFDIEYFNNIGISTVPALSAAEAAGYADEGIGSKVKTDKILTSDKAFILPVKSGSSVEYRLVYNVEVKPVEDYSNYCTYVDANNGAVVWRYNTVQRAEEFDIKGGVKLKDSDGQETIVPFANMYVDKGSKLYLSDSKGIVHYDGETPAAVSTKFTGPWVRILGVSYTINKVTDTVKSGNHLTMLLNDSNSHTYERNQFYHTNYIHDFYKALDPQLNCIDIQFSVFLNYKQQASGPNAYSDGDTIVFIGLGIQSGRFPGGPGVLYHEYGHSITTLFYESKGQSEGMVNSTLHEAIADMTTAFLLDESRITIGAFSDPNLYIRQLKNDKIYPDSMNGESHYDSQILSGAMWDLKEKTSLELVRKLSHYARYGLPDDRNVGAAFYQWLFEILVCDDDDGNLANGTPHYKEIIESFNRHHIGLNLFYTNNFNHTAYEETGNTTSPYKIDFDFGDGKSALGRPDSAFVSYQVRYKGEVSPFQTVPAVSINNDFHYSASVPPQKQYSIVKYFIRLYTYGSSEPITFGCESESKPYVFLVGFDTYLKDGFETNSNWKTGSSADNAVHGIWERGLPYKIDMVSWGYDSSEIVKPAENHTSNGRYYYSTGLSYPDSVAYDKYEIITYLVPDGNTSLASPVFDLTNYNNVFFKYYIYFRSSINPMLNGFPIQNPYLITELSNDGGVTWGRVSIDTTVGNSSWQKKLICINDYLTTTNKCRIRFRFFTYNGYPIFLSSASIDDFEILTAGSSNDVDEGKPGQAGMFVCPNPFTDNISISYNAEADCRTSINISSLQGELIYQSETQSTPGVNIFVWDGTGADRLPVPQGIYFYRVVTGNSVATGKIIKN